MSKASSKAVGTVSQAYATAFSGKATTHDVTAIFAIVEESTESGFADEAG